MVDVTDFDGERGIRNLYRAAAISNAVATIPAFLAYDRYVDAFTDEPPRYPFLVHIWAGMAALWGVSFWEISATPSRPAGCCATPGSRSASPRPAWLWPIGAARFPPASWLA